MKISSQIHVIYYVCHVLGNAKYFNKLEPFQANFLLRCSAKFANFTSNGTQKYVERASIKKGTVGCYASYPTSSHFSRTFLLKLYAASGIFNVSFSIEVLHYQPK